MNEKQGMLIFKLEGVPKQFFCENRNCEYNKIDYAYSWLHVKDLKWKFVLATKEQVYRNGVKYPETIKASSFNSDLKDDGGNYIELYCPMCGEKLNL